MRMDTSEFMDRSYIIELSIVVLRDHVGARNQIHASERAASAPDQ